ncbi:unnamed protein product [Parnassius apollo]|uniref:(apollo) hypothetical protein n=1 Tax=Parnassius apollo TaxID=110799 RepID=A0A8S3YCG6_PARAO|nr:unnamed protein product [Parnassius apollo]
MLQEYDLLGEDEKIGDGSGYAAECIREPHSDNEDADYINLCETNTYTLHHNTDDQSLFVCLASTTVAMVNVNGIENEGELHTVCSDSSQSKAAARAARFMRYSVRLIIHDLARPCRNSKFENEVYRYSLTTV